MGGGGLGLQKKVRTATAFQECSAWFGTSQQVTIVEQSLFGMLESASLLMDYWWPQESIFKEEKLDGN